MRPHQLKAFNQGHESVLNDLMAGVQIDAAALIVLLNDVIASRGEMSEQVAHRDNNLELLGTTTEKFPTVDVLGHDLAGRIRALVAYSNASIVAGVKVTIRGE